MPISNTQILLDTQKRTVVKVTGSGTDVANTTIINANTLNGAISGLGYHEVDVRKIIYSITDGGGYVKLYWQGASANVDMVNITGQGVLEFQPEAMVLNNNATNPSGNIGFSTTGMSANSAYTVILDLRKNTAHFDPGSALDPAAFNR
jgi:hypothetical protein